MVARGHLDGPLDGVPDVVLEGRAGYGLAGVLLYLFKATQKLFSIKGPMGTPPLVSLLGVWHLVEFGFVVMEAVHFDDDGDFLAFFFVQQSSHMIRESRLSGPRDASNAH
uniref:Uncharacterized protein n=1 Tax=Arcella intermedia TaxID=1963864 RepID=A0A6B2LSG3_9EUKA